MNIQISKSNIKLLALLGVAIVAMMLFLFLNRIGNQEKNPLLIGDVRYARVLGDGFAKDADGNTYVTGEGYGYKSVEVRCNEETVAALSEQEYIDFLKRGVEGSSDYAWEYKIIMEDSGIIYFGGDSSTGYYVDLYYGDIFGNCKIKGIIQWNGEHVTYTPTIVDRYVTDIIQSSPMPEKYKLLDLNDYQVPEKFKPN